MTDANYEDILKENPQILVNFYGPRCGLYKTLALEYSKAAYDLNSRYPPIKIAKCDGANNPILVEKFGVTGYPTLKYILEDDLLIYSGRLTSESLTS